jgi:hypothetical protein
MRLFKNKKNFHKINRLEITILCLFVLFFLPLSYANHVTTDSVRFGYGSSTGSSYSGQMVKSAYGTGAASTYSSPTYIKSGYGSSTGSSYSGQMVKSAYGTGAASTYSSPTYVKSGYGTSAPASTHSVQSYVKSGYGTSAPASTHSVQSYVKSGYGTSAPVYSDLQSRTWVKVGPTLYSDSNHGYRYICPSKLYSSWRIKYHYTPVANINSGRANSYYIVHFQQQKIIPYKR